MKTTHILLESDCDTPSNVIPLWTARSHPLGRAPRPARVQPHPAAINALEQEPAEERLARRVERVLCALLYHAVLAPGDLRSSKSFSIEQRVARLVSRDRLTAISAAAIKLDSIADLTRLAAVAIFFELQNQGRWRNRGLRLVSAAQRQIHADTLAIAHLLACDLEALKLRPIDGFAQFL